MAAVTQRVSPVRTILSDGVTVIGITSLIVCHANGSLSHITHVAQMNIRINRPKPVDPLRILVAITSKQIIHLSCLIVAIIAKYVAFQGLYVGYG